MRQDFKISQLQFISNHIPAIYRPKRIQLKAGQTATQTSLHLNRSAQMHTQRKSREHFNQRKKVALSTSDLSIDHIKNKINQLLHTNRDAASANLQVENLRELRSTRDSFRSIFKNYNKKKMQLKMLDGIQSDKGGHIAQEFRVHQACINRRSSIKEQNSNVAFSRNDRLRHLCRPRPQDVSLIFQPFKLRRQSVGQREKSTFSKDLLRFAEMQHTVEPWKQTQFEQFQDFAAP